MRFDSSDTPIDHVTVTSDNNIRIALRRGIIKATVHCGSNPVIGIYEADIFTSRIGNTSITCRAKT